MTELSKSQSKRIAKQMEAEAYILQSKEERAKERWEDAQIKAASAKSVIDYAVKQYEEHKEELEPEMIKQIEEQIQERNKQIEDFIMTEKDIYLESMGIQAD
jgi:hypothetical protein